MTKVDVACSLVAEDLKTIYHSVYIQKKVKQWYEWCVVFCHVSMVTFS